MKSNSVHDYVHKKEDDLKETLMRNIQQRSTSDQNASYGSVRRYYTLLLRPSEPHFTNLCSPVLYYTVLY